MPIERGDVRERVEIPVRIASKNGQLAGSIDKSSGSGQSIGSNLLPQVTTTNSGDTSSGVTTYPFIWGVSLWGHDNWTEDIS